MNESPHEGLYVFDLRDFSLTQFFPGGYRSLVKASDDENTFVAFHDCGHIDVLSLKEGELSRKFSFPLVSTHSVSRILLVYQSHAYVLLYEGERLRRNARGIDVYNILNGDRVRAGMLGSTWVSGASTNGQELFFGTGTEDEGGDSMIEVYSSRFPAC